jgi:hypothetical protein
VLAGLLVLLGRAAPPNIAVIHVHPDKDVVKVVTVAPVVVANLVALVNQAGSKDLPEEAEAEEEALVTLEPMVIMETWELVEILGISAPQEIKVDLAIPVEVVRVVIRVVVGIRVRAATLVTPALQEVRDHRALLIPVLQVPLALRQLILESQ